VGDFKQFKNLEVVKMDRKEVITEEPEKCKFCRYRWECNLWQSGKCKLDEEKENKKVLEVGKNGK